MARPDLQPRGGETPLYNADRFFLTASISMCAVFTAFSVGMGAWAIKEGLSEHTGLTKAIEIAVLMAMPGAGCALPFAMSAEFLCAARRVELKSYEEDRANRKRFEDRVSAHQKVRDQDEKPAEPRSRMLPYSSQQPIRL